MAAWLMAVLLAAAAGPALAADQPQWGPPSRNMVSAEKNLPATFDPRSGKNIKWVATLGSRTYATPTIAGGKVLIGTNNGRPRDSRHTGDRGVLMCFNESDGALCWQLVIPKIPKDPYLDCPGVGICSPASIEGDRVYVVTNRAEVLCLDLAGMADGNDGPFRDEAKLSVPAGAEPVPPGPKCADVIWRVDMREPPIGMYPHDSAHSAILIDGDYLYLNTGNGVDNTHRKIRRPDAPSLIVLDKKTGRLVAADGERIGPRIFHCTWSSPALAKVAGRRLAIFGGGDGVVYAFEAVKQGRAKTQAPAVLKKIWSFDCDPSAPKENVSQYMRNRKVSPSNIKGMCMVHDGRVYVASGGDIWWGKRVARLQCIDATGTGDVTKTGLRWSYPLERHCCGTPAIHEGLVYIADCGRMVHCVDADTGKAVWTHKANGDMWTTPLIADGKVYVGTRRGDFLVFAAGREKRVLAELDLDSPIHASAVAANGVLYVATMKYLYAVQTGAQAPTASQ